MFSWGNITVSEDALPRTVFVSNISPRATQDNVMTFFSYCGKVSAFDMKESGDGQEAVLTFDAPTGYTTALLLSNASIVDRPISVAPFTADRAETQTTSAPDGEAPATTATTTAATTTAATSAEGAGVGDTDAPFPEPLTSAFAAPKSHTAVLAEMVAAGYSLGASAVSKARELDARTLNLHGTLQKAGHRLTEASHVVDSSVAAVDRTLQFSERAAAASAAVEGAVTSIADAAMQYSIVQTAVEHAKRATDVADAAINSTLIATEEAINRRLGGDAGNDDEDDDVQ